ncbi:Sugar phosphate isomerase/epimerase [Geosporobacter subterraneus DSM 17957]|uniref:Sugar phosphate isomerase/epimerase n=1 Tax=Geosporobacter subterraneus DSM 17957 TaxID=1121919 RepID=A0A1M6MM59_9FIRM|nr:sugar phosphate isomerase/epimerase family protein [Geosporobacter subterraneus]SHJ84476.1 Sugar phosphate isomerase/epimerase [Geosporobacter subterraneus DSM 17957]
MRLAIQDNLLGMNHFRDSFRLAKEIGFDGVELNFFQRNLIQADALEIAKASEITGVEVAAVCGGYLNWIADFDEEKRHVAVEGVRTSLEYIAHMGGVGLIAPAAYGMYARRFPAKRPLEEDRRILLDSLNRIAESAEKHKVMFYLEPLNRYEDHMINMISEGAAYIDEVGSKQVKLLGDIFHMNIEEDNVIKTMEQYNSHIGYYHLADSNRKLPGLAHTDFKSIFHKLKELKYNGLLSIECHLRGETVEGIRRSLDFLRSL